MALESILPPKFTSWIYDCDLASPTPEWYLTDSDAMKQKRQNIKQKWTTCKSRNARLKPYSERLHKQPQGASSSAFAKATAGQASKASRGK